MGLISYLLKKSASKQRKRPTVLPSDEDLTGICYSEVDHRPEIIIKELASPITVKYKDEEPDPYDE